MNADTFMQTTRLITGISKFEFGRLTGCWSMPIWYEEFCDVFISCLKATQNKEKFVVSGPRFTKLFEIKNDVRKSHILIRVCARGAKLPRRAQTIHA